MQMFTQVWTPFVISRTAKNFRYQNDNIVVDRSFLDVSAIKKCLSYIPCYDFVAFIYRMVSCLHVDFKCFKLALWLTWRHNFMNPWSFFTRPGAWISLVGRAFDCRAGGRGFDSRGRTITQGLKMTEKWGYFLCTASGETFAWLGWPRKMAVPSPLGDVKIVSPVSTFVLNTLTLK